MEKMLAKYSMVLSLQCQRFTLLIILFFNRKEKVFQHPKVPYTLICIFRALQEILFRKITAASVNLSIYVFPEKSAAKQCIKVQGREGTSDLYCKIFCSVYESNQ
jgi:hypothetical protein